MTISKTNSGCSYEKQSSIARPKQSRQVQKILSWRKEKMNDKITCEKCGSEMRPIDSNKPVGSVAGAGQHLIWILCEMMIRHILYPYLKEIV